MYVIIAGSRTIKDFDLVSRIIEEASFDITEVVSGTSSGVDQLGERWATERGLPVKRFEPNWILHGKYAGPRRNEEMAKYADALIVVWNGTSAGTKHMIKVARKYKLRTYVYRTDR